MSDSSEDADRNDDLPVREFESADWPVTVAKVLSVVRRGPKPAQLFIDGAPFGYATSGGMTAGPARKNQLPSVTLTLVGYRVEFVDDMSAAPDDAPDPESESTP